MRVKIISDSTCDLSPALLERYDIAVTPLCVIKDGKDFHDGVDITPADIFAHVDGGGDLCSTSAVSQYEYGEMFARYANEYDAVVQITIGANFSCCYQNACAAAQEYENFYQEEILYRELSGYPPVAHMLAVQIYGKEEENVKQLALRLTDVVKSNMDFLSGKQKEQSNKKIQVLGPAPANISKINDIYRYVFYVKHAEYDVLVEVKDRLEETLRQWQPRQMSIQFDFDPVSVL